MVLCVIVKCHGIVDYALSMNNIKIFEESVPFHYSFSSKWSLLIELNSIDIRD